MGNILCFLLSIYILSLIISMFGGFLRFLRDIRKWKSPEEKVHITVKEFEHDLEQAAEEEVNESEVSESAGDDREHNSPIIF